jgi:hypothetical protein
MNGASGPAESLIIDDLTPALAGSDPDRVSWGLRAGPICAAVAATVAGRPAPSAITREISQEFQDAMGYYVELANEWVAQDGRHTPLADVVLTAANESYNLAVELIDTQLR